MKFSKFQRLKSWMVPIWLSELFLRSESKNDLWLKVRLIKSLAASDQKKILDLEEFFNAI